MNNFLQVVLSFWRWWIPKHWLTFKATENVQLLRRLLCWPLDHKPRKRTKITGRFSTFSWGQAHSLLLCDGCILLYQCWAHEESREVFLWKVICVHMSQTQVIWWLDTWSYYRSASCICSSHNVLRMCAPGIDSVYTAGPVPAGRPGWAWLPLFFISLL